MALNLSKLHPYKVENGQTVMGKPNPAVSLSHEGEAPIFIQGGKTYRSDGDVIPRSDLPEWFWSQVKSDKMNPEVLAECGWKDTGSRKKRAPRELEETLQDASE